jgi:hypothetical protein
VSSNRVVHPAVVLTYCALCGLAQGAGLLAVQQTKYRMRAGETVPVAAPRETLDFIRQARNRVTRCSGVSGEAFVIEPSVKGDQVVLVATYAMKPGEYTVSLSAESETGEKRVMTVHVTLDPMQAAPSTPIGPTVVEPNGWQSPIVSTPALIEQGWVVQGAFERIAPALRADVQSRLILDGSYDSLDASATRKSPAEQ